MIGVDGDGNVEVVIHADFQCVCRVVVHDGSFLFPFVSALLDFVSCLQFFRKKSHGLSEPLQYLPASSLQVSIVGEEIFNEYHGDDGKESTKAKGVFFGIMEQYPCMYLCFVILKG